MIWILNIDNAQNFINGGTTNIENVKHKILGLIQVNIVVKDTTTKCINFNCLNLLVVVQTTARVLSFAYRFFLPFLINRVLDLTKLRSVITKKTQICWVNHVTNRLRFRQEKGLKETTIKKRLIHIRKKSNLRTHC